MSRKKIGSTSNTPSAPDNAIRQAVLARFKLEDLQYLEGDDLNAARQLCGHGITPGHWETDLEGLSHYLREIDLAKRIQRQLRVLDGEEHMEVHNDLVTEAVQTLTRLGLLLRLAPVGGKRSEKTKPLKPSTVANCCHNQWPKMIALAIRRKVVLGASGAGLFCHLNEDDRQTIAERPQHTYKFNHLFTLADKGLWWDVPARQALPVVTAPSSKPLPRKRSQKSVPHPPLPLDWLGEIGPRVLWVITELAPNLLRLLDALREPLQQPGLLDGKLKDKLKALIEMELARHPWLDTTGKPLMPPFQLLTANVRGGVGRHEWLTPSWSHVTRLSAIVQAAHAFVALLATAGRIQEDASLKRSCVEVHADGSDHVRGRTYKLNWALHGQERTWPAPSMLIRALGQQARLAAAWDWLPLNAQSDAVPTKAQFGDQLWISIGVGGLCGPEARFTWKYGLMQLAKCLGLTDKPGGKNVHPHRFRKTTSMLAGIALWNSPLVLKQLLGHKDIEMTLHYILSDPGIREEAEKVLREMRVMHCAQTLQKVRDALEAGLPNPFGGIGGERLAGAVSEHERREKQADRQWTTDTPYILANEYTMNGTGWRLGPGFICSKLPHEAGDCQKGKSRRGEHGEPHINNCKRTCPQRVELPVQIAMARRKRDVEEVCDGYLAIASEAIGEGNLLVAAHSVRQLGEVLDDWPELKARYEARPELRAVSAAIGCEDGAEIEIGNG